MIVDDWEVQIEDKPAKADRIGHEISDDYDRETSVVEQVLAAAVKRREEISKKQGGNQYGGQVSLCNNNNVCVLQLHAYVASVHSSFNFDIIISYFSS